MKAQHGASPPFHCSMILPHELMEYDERTPGLGPLLPWSFLSFPYPTTTLALTNEKAGYRLPGFSCHTPTISVLSPSHAQLFDFLPVAENHFRGGALSQWHIVCVYKSFITAEFSLAIIALDFSGQPGRAVICLDEGIAIL